ncbi:ribonuclease H-like domain-containing protein [Tanacetum coccineum]
MESSHVTMLGWQEIHQERHEGTWIQRKQPVYLDKSQVDGYNLTQVKGTLLSKAIQMEPKGKDLMIAKWEESSKSLNILLNSQISAHDKNGLGYDTQLNEMSDKSETDSEISMSVFDVRSSDEESTPVNNRFSKADGYHVVPPPITGNFLTPRADISFAVVSTPNINKDKVIIEDWNSDDENDVSEVSPVKTNETQTAKTQKPRPKTENVVNTGQRVVKPVWDNAKRVNHQKNSNKLNYPQARRTFVPSGVLTRTGLVNPVRPNEKRAVQTINTARPVSTARSVSTARPFAPKTAQTSSAVRPIYPRMDNVRPKKPHIHQYEGNPEICLQDHAVVDSGCSSHMTGNKAYLSDYEDYNRGFVAFGSDPKGGKITGKGKIRTANLDFDDVYFVDELKFNLFMSYHPNKNTSLTEKNSVLFTDTECLILSPSFKLLDENQVVLRAPRQNGVYSLDLKNIVPSGATKDETAEKILCEIIKWLKNAIEPQIKIIDVIRDRVKNHAMNEFYARRKKGSSVLELHSRNGVAERKNKTLIEAARTMLADSLLPIPFWAEAVNTACYVLNRVLVTKPQNKTPYELLIGSGPDWMFDLDFLTNTMNYIPVSVENQITVDAGTQESYVAGSSGKDKEPTQEYILLPLHPHRPRIPVEDVIQDAQEKSSENAPNDKGELD